MSFDKAKVSEAYVEAKFHRNTNEQSGFDDALFLRKRAVRFVERNATTTTSSSDGHIMHGRRSIIKKRDDDDVTLTRPLTKRVSFSVSNQTRLFTIDSDESKQSTAPGVDLSSMAFDTSVAVLTTSSRSRLETSSRFAGDGAPLMMDITLPSSAIEDDDWLQEGPSGSQPQQSTSATETAESIPSAKHDNEASEAHSPFHSEELSKPTEDASITDVAGSEKRTSVQQDEVTNLVELCTEQTSAVREELLKVAENILPSAEDKHLLDIHRIKATLHDRMRRRKGRPVQNQPVHDHTLVDGTLINVRFSNILPDITVREWPSPMGEPNLPSSAPSEMSQQFDTSTLDASGEVPSECGTSVVDGTSAVDDISAANHNTLDNSLLDQGSCSGVLEEDSSNVGNNSAVDSEANMDSSEYEDDSVQFSCGEIATMNCDVEEGSNEPDDTCCSPADSHQHEASESVSAFGNLTHRGEEDTGLTVAADATTTTVASHQDNESADGESDNDETNSNQSFEEDEAKQASEIYELDAQQQATDQVSDDVDFDGPQEQVQNDTLSQPGPDRPLDVSGVQTLDDSQWSPSALSDVNVETVGKEGIPSSQSETFVKEQQPPHGSTQSSEAMLQPKSGNNLQAGGTMEISASLINKTYSVHEPREASHENAQPTITEQEISNLDDEMEPLNYECSQPSTASSCSTQTPLNTNRKLQGELLVTQATLRIPSPMPKEPFQLEFSDEELFKAYPDIFDGLGGPMPQEPSITPPPKIQIDFGMDASELARKVKFDKNLNLQQSMSQQLDELRSVNREYVKLLARLNDFRVRAEAEPLIDPMAVEDVAPCILVETDFIENTATVTYSKHCVPLVEILCREGPKGSVVGRIMSCLGTDNSEGEGLDALAPLMVTWARHSLLRNPDAQEWSAATRLEATAKIRAAMEVLEKNWAYFNGIELLLHADDRMTYKTGEERVFLRFAWRCREIKVFIDANLQEEIIVGEPLANTCRDYDLKLDELYSIWKNNATLPFRQRIEMAHLKTLDLASVDMIEQVKR